mmetsp:Transcript_8565/g.19213  ORF Transcript_8565/g.19213 Transcript_8565/m.19213 type:complete len:360 (-) Transcript_8565:529-1608(-)|eukprot:CAMPEP_0172316322 /NCGR_PEP_ID=MMETSP1058-20130122/27785_1 /TAXON_ID=83371 /ORGANISM="Detonula confervacea, Strain CCMP 353" /LENGTH=359 /DNA_ID=CAMNT_0013030605 /DNA_START=150 /DNA_END=1229 /DNA_ORIENTATION=+
MGVIERLISQKSDAAIGLAIPESATCWICLDGRSDNHEPLARACACRGEGGFCHLECIAQFAESREKESAVKGGVIEISLWTTCNTCRQPYSGQFNHDLAEVHWNTYKNKDPKQVQSFHDLRLALDHMGGALLDQHRIDEALEFTQRLYDLQKGQIVENGDGTQILHWIEPVEIAQTCNRLGGCFLRLGQLDRAMSVFCDGLNHTVSRKEGALLDSEIAGTEAVLLNNLAEVYVKRGEVSKAVPLRRQAHALREKVHGKNSYDYVQGAFSLGCVLLDGRNREEGIELIEESREIALRILGPLHHHVMKCDHLLEQLGAAVDRETNSSVVGRWEPNMATIIGLKSRADLNRKLVEVSGYL